MMIIIIIIIMSLDKSWTSSWRTAWKTLETAPVLKGLGRFPSDHWGLLTEWTVTTVTSPTTSIPRAVLPIPASDRRVVIDLDA